MIRSSEDRLVISTKMDATVGTGVWLNFPTIAAGGSHGKIAAGRIYYELLQAEEYYRSKKKKKRKETAKEMRTRLLKEVEKRIIQKNNDELVLLLAI